jgi:hypothetical protein
MVKLNGRKDRFVIRQNQAYLYPAYNPAYRQHLHSQQHYLAAFENSQPTALNNMHPCESRDVSMLSAMLATKDIAKGCQEYLGLARRSLSLIHNSFPSEGLNQKRTTHIKRLATYPTTTILGIIGALLRSLSMARGRHW